MPKTAALDPDAQAFLTAAAITDPTISSAINTLVVQMKADNIWTKMKAIYPMVGGTASTHKWNLKDPRDLDAAFRLTFSGGWTHSANGALPNGTNGYADTFFIPSINGSLNSIHLSYYSRTNANTSSVEMGCFGSGSNALYIMYSYLGTQYKALNRVAATEGSLYTPTTGLLIGNRANSTTEKYFFNGSLIDTISRNSVGLPTYKIHISGFNSNGTNSSPSSKECAFASIGEGLTDTEAANFYTAVQAFQTTLNRQIV